MDKSQNTPFNQQKYTLAGERNTGSQRIGKQAYRLMETIGHWG
jgi:hypothetical protein